MKNKDNYIQALKERAKKSRIYKSYQFVGLTIAKVLSDDKHKSLYIKLAKKHSSDHLLAIAKDVAQRKKVKNKGAYFMKVLEKTHPYLLKNSKPQSVDLRIKS